MRKSNIEMPDEPVEWKNSEAPAEPEVGEYYLPGVGKTYLNPEFAGKVADFIQRTSSQGISLLFGSGYRSQAKQDRLPSDPTAITPARHSLHSAGRGVDIGNWSALGPEVQRKVLQAAQDAGLGWGGTYRAPDRPHFFLDPGTDRRQLIDNFTRAVAAFQSQIPDR